ncbi:hypothetical protein CR513_33099, partial [Mucuna pruriens]
MMFLGYDSIEAYKLYNFMSKKIVISNDVVVDESKDYTFIPNFVLIEKRDMMHLALLAKIEPMSFEQVIKELEWKTTMKEKLRVTEKNHMWELVTLPHNKKSIGQKACLNYNEVFAPVVRIETITLVMLQPFLESIFLNESLEEEVYVCKPPSFEVTEHENKKNRLLPFQLNFNKCTIEYEVYVRVIASDLMIVCLYVDDLLVIGSNTTNIDEFKKRITMKFEMTDL